MAQIWPMARNLLEQDTAVAEWMLKQQQVLITDTTIRGDQSLLAADYGNRYDQGAPSYAANLPQLFSIECAGARGTNRWCGNVRGSACAIAQCNAELDDTDVAARLKRRWIHKLSRSCAVAWQRRPKASMCSASLTV